MEFKKDLKREVTVVDASDYSIKRGDKKDYKTFMSHKISKVVEGERKKPEGNKRRRNQEEQEEDLNDKELASILEMQKKIEELNNKDLVGKERLEYQKKKLIGMGLDKISKTRVPRDAFYGIQNKKEKRAKKEIEEMRNRGVLTDGIKREIEEKHIKRLVEYKKKKSKVKDRGVIVGSGKFKEGVLYVSKRDIEKNTKRKL